MRVVHIITGLRAGGAERLLFDRTGVSQHDIHVVTLAADGVFADRLRERGIPVHSIGMSSNRDIRALWRTSRLLKSLDPDVVHVHLYRAMLFGRLSARMAGIRRIVATEHSASADATEGRRATRGVKLMYWFAERLGTTTVAVSSKTRDDLVDHWGIPARRIVVIPNGVAVDHLRPTHEMREEARGSLGFRPDDRVLISAGRLARVKHVDVLIEAVAKLREVDKRVHLVLIGQGVLREELERQALRLRCADAVHFVGERSDVLPFLAAGDAYVSASTVETYGIAIIEGYVAGLPVVYVTSPAADDLKAAHSVDRLIKVDPGAAAVAPGIALALDMPASPDLVAPEVLDSLDIGRTSSCLDDLELQVAASPTTRRRRKYAE